MFLLVLAGVFNPSLWKVQEKFSEFDGVSFTNAFAYAPHLGVAHPNSDCKGKKIRNSDVSSFQEDVWRIMVCCAITASKT